MVTLAFVGTARKSHGNFNFPAGHVLKKVLAPFFVRNTGTAAHSNFWAAVPAQRWAAKTGICEPRLNHSREKSGLLA